ncbi:MAG: queuosine biosynthesis protein [Frankiales bacterium]|nr:queuosine biosynthesis protein [Frankiales bacterium]
MPRERFATAPPEARGLKRDGVRLLVAEPDGHAHSRFRHLAEFLHTGDLVVVNDSATVASALDGHRFDGRPATVHVGAPLAGGELIVELRDPARVRDAATGETLALPHGASLRLLAAYPDEGQRIGSRLWRAGLTVDGLPADYLARFARPISYDYVPHRWPLTSYQTMFSTKPGSAEMPSAGRPFTPEVVADLARHGVGLATVTLHTGLSSLVAGETPLPERFDVPDATARLVNATVAGGGRVVAVGTTVTRALETVAGDDGRVVAGAGVTELVLGPDRPTRVVTGLVTGWHDAEASHVLLLEAVAGRALVRAAYRAALDGDYLWHEFGDSALLLPARGVSPRRPAASG